MSKLTRSQQLLSATEICAGYGITKSMLNKLVKHPNFPAPIRLGGLVGITQRNLKRYWQTGEVQTFFENYFAASKKAVMVEPEDVAEAAAHNPASEGSSLK